MKPYNMYLYRYVLVFVFLYIACAPFSLFAAAKVKVGSDLLFTPEYVSLLKHKKIGLIINHTAINSRLEATLDSLKHNAKKYRYTVTALFAPEHGLDGLGMPEKRSDTAKT